MRASKIETVRLLHGNLAAQYIPIRVYKSVRLAWPYQLSKSNQEEEEI